jgi:hypothetical protein
MKRIAVRPPECGGDNFTVLRNSLNRIGRELSVGEVVAIDFDPAAFSFTPAVFEGLMRGAGLTLVEDTQAGGLRSLVVRRD